MRLQLGHNLRHGCHAHLSPKAELVIQTLGRAGQHALQSSVPRQEQTGGAADLWEAQAAKMSERTPEIRRPEKSLPTFGRSGTNGTE